MISDMLTVVIIALLVVLVVYPASRIAWQCWTNRQKQQARASDVARRP